MDLIFSKNKSIKQKNFILNKEYNKEKNFFFIISRGISILRAHLQTCHHTCNNFLY